MELIILSLVEHHPRHGYEIHKLIIERAGGTFRPTIASLYPLLARLEKRGYVAAYWEKVVKRRPRKKYQLTLRGKHALDKQMAAWNEFVLAVCQIITKELL